ncbi:oxalyl-CoA decarboxylase [Alloscardovia theropitheci]|uniref:Oxalyl-CoA decarboxylase n=1 Tax=Alloscardovia theropitheci TaxID=2496842 RepID=A0A4R0QYP8_9BIFI|nr:oxalyl-CoA decarboxylase [Alloscardovia theropitheci]TCD53626.1 oxalyl-CoA decarboxylase [Alloscardovia theropitheci]
MSDSTTKSGAELLIDALKINGIQNIYGLVGIPVTDLARLAQIEGMNYYGFRREDAAVNAAAAAGFITGKPGIALTVSAPGFLNGLPSLAQATKNCFPLIMISGSSDRNIIDLDQGDYEGLDQYNIAKPFCKAAFRVNRAEDMGTAVARAIRTAVSGRPGGVYLDLPAEAIESMMIDDKKGNNVYEIVDPAPSVIPSDESISRAINIIKNSQKPLVIVGKGAASARAEKEVKELIDTLNVPYLPMSMAKGLIPDDDSHSAAAARSYSLKNADTIILLGARLNWLLSHGKAPVFNESAQVIQIDIDAYEFDSNRRIDAPILGDMKSSLRKLIDAVHEQEVTVESQWLDDVQNVVLSNKEKMRTRLEAGKTSEPLNFFGALLPLQEYMNEHPDTYLVSEGANTLDMGRNIIDMKLPRHRLDCGTWGVMGIGLGYAIAAAVETGKRVIALEGDSAFGFDAMEMETICRYHLPVTVVVLNNGGIYNGTDKVVDNQPSPTNLDPRAHYEYLSSAFGGDSYVASTYSEVKDALVKAMDSNNPSIINATLNPSAGTESGHIDNLNAKIDLKKAANNL